MNYFIDVAYDSINKFREELCGDNVEVIRTEDSIIIVVADGLGSGVKANILSTLTSKIAGTMLKEGADICETVDTIVHTLPVCNVRKIAYSTFTIIKVYYDGRVYIAEYDNPPFFLIRGDTLCTMDKTDAYINGKLVKESIFTMNEDDILMVVTDGVIHAGVGAVLNLGWQWSNVADYLCRTASGEKSSWSIGRSLLNVCQRLYDDKPGDDATVVTVRLRQVEPVDLFTGPPEDPANDPLIIRKLMEGKGKKVICGGTAGNIAARELKQAIEIDLDTYDPILPPVAKVKGLDLVTEGALTLKRTVEIIKSCLKHYGSDKKASSRYQDSDGASQLARMLIEDCTHLNIWTGRAVNPAHRDMMGLNMKLKLVEELAVLMKELGRVVHLTYI